MQCQPSGPNRQFTCFPIDQQAPFAQTNQEEILPGSQQSLQMVSQNLRQFPSPGPAVRAQEIFGRNQQQLILQHSPQQPLSVARSTTTLPPFIGPHMPAV